MEGDKKRKRASSDSGHVRTLDSCSDVLSESTPRLDADVALEASSGAEVYEKTTKTMKHAGGRPPRTARGMHFDNWHDNAANRERMRAKRALSAEQVRHVVSVALDFPRTPVFTSATSLIHV